MNKLTDIFVAKTRLTRTRAPKDWPLAGVTSVKDAEFFASEMLSREAVEVTAIMLLNTRQMILGWAEVSRGTVSEALVHPREVFGPAIRLSSSGVILTHNHPGGSVDPSEQDEALTYRMIEAGALLGVEFLDHIIVAPGAAKSYSFKMHRPDIWASVKDQLVEKPWINIAARKPYP